MTVMLPLINTFFAWERELRECEEEDMFMVTLDIIFKFVWLEIIQAIINSFEIGMIF